MNSGDRLKALFFVWGAFALAAIANVGSGSPLRDQNVVIAFFLVIAAMVATRYIMYAPASSSEEAGKAKRSRVERVLASLSDDELDALRQRLADDGELVSLDEALRKDRQR